MRDQLLHHYERELRFIRRLAADFTERYPAIAGQLLLEPDKCEDPHVERLIEAFAILAARVQVRLDDEFSEITSAFLGALYPQLLAPVPSFTIVQFFPDASRTEATSGIRIPRHALLHTRPVGGVRCKFRTCSAVTLWPIQVTGVDVLPLDRGQPGCPPETAGALRIRLQTLGAQTFADLPLDALRFFLDGSGAVAHELYELLLRAPRGVLARPAAAAGAARGSARRGPAPGVCLPPERIRPAGFAPEDGLLDGTGASQLGYRLLQEYFCFPDKYLFVEIDGLSGGALAGCGKELELLVLLDHVPLELGTKLGPENVKLGCVPAANLFPHQAEPIRLTHAAPEYQIVPDAHAGHAYEVYAVQEVESVEPGTGAVRAYRPFFSLRHGDPREGEPAFWHAGRRPSPHKDDAGTEVFLTLVDRDARLLEELPSETLIVRALCSNRDLPPRLPLGDERGDFQIEGQPGVTHVRCLRKPTPPLRPDEQREGHWRLVSLLQLNHLSLLGKGAAAGGKGGGAGMGGGARVGGGEAEDPVAFRELLSLLDFTGSAANKLRISGLTGLRTNRVLRRVTVDGSRVFARGLEITLEFDETKYAGSGAFLFASLLERFLGLYTTINSFTQVVAIGRQREEVLKRWPPRAGQITLV